MGEGALPVVSAKFDAALDQALIQLRSSLRDALTSEYRRCMAVGAKPIASAKAVSASSCPSKDQPNSQSKDSINLKVSDSAPDNTVAPVSHGDEKMFAMIADRKKIETALRQKKLVVQRSSLKNRMRLESNLVWGTTSFVAWLAIFIPFMIAFDLLDPGYDIGSVHEMALEHYGLQTSKLLEVKEWDHVYSFMEKFKLQNDLLQPTGVVYWQSPRFLHKLGLTAAGETEYQRQKEMQHVLSEQPAHGSGKRRLSSTSDEYSSSVEAKLMSLRNIYQNPTSFSADVHGHPRNIYDCKHPSLSDLINIHSQLEKKREAAQGSNSSTSSVSRRRRTESYGPHADYSKYFPEFVGEYETVLPYNHQKVNVSRPNTDTYLPRYRYPYPIISLLPPVVYQKRLKVKECKRDSFADRFLNQDINILSPIFGRNAPKDTDIIDCVDCSKSEDAAIAKDIDTDRFNFLGDSVYARLAGSPGDHSGGQFSDWMRIGWLGKQTKEAVISVLLYTEHLEVFTSVSIHVIQKESGVTRVERSIKSVAELDERGTAFAFHFLCWYVVVSGTLVLCMNIRTMLHRRKKLIKDTRREHFSMFSTLAIVVFTFTVEILYRQRENMNNLFLDIMNTFLKPPNNDFTHDGEVWALQHFFEVKEQIHNIDSQYAIIKIFGTIVYVLQVVQLVFHLGTHPRVDLLFATLSKIMNDVLHYCIIFIFVFVLLGYYGHWMFSGILPHIFGTFGGSLLKQMEMIVGFADNWPWSDVEVMNHQQKGSFMLYVALYFGIVFLILLNFFIAIVLEGFNGVWKGLHEEQNLGGVGHWVVTDACQAWVGYIEHLGRKWPKRGKIAHKIECLEEKEDDFETSLNATISETQLWEDYGFSDEASAMDFLSSVGHRAPAILRMPLPEQTQ